MQSVSNDTGVIKVRLKVPVKGAGLKVPVLTKLTK